MRWCRSSSRGVIFRDIYGRQEVSEKEDKGWSERLRAFFITSSIFIGFLTALALATFLILVDTSPMGRMEYLFEIGRLSVFRYTGLGRMSDWDVKLIYEGSCIRKCHSRDVVERSAHTVREWEEIIGRMRAVNKANVTDNEAKVITAYLTKQY